MKRKQDNCEDTNNDENKNRQKIEESGTNHVTDSDTNSHADVRQTF